MKCFVWGMFRLLNGEILKWTGQNVGSHKSSSRNKIRIFIYNDAEKLFHLKLGFVSVIYQKF